MWKVFLMCENLKTVAKRLKTFSSFFDLFSKYYRIKMQTLVLLHYIMNYLYSPLIEPSKLKAFRSCNAQVHKSHVVKPSELIVSSQNGGRGGGGTNLPFHKPLSLASNGNGE